MTTTNHSHDEFKKEPKQSDTPSPTPVGEPHDIAVQRLVGRDHVLIQHPLLSVDHPHHSNDDQWEAALEWAEDGSDLKCCLVEKAPEFLKKRLVEMGFNPGEAVAVWVE